MGKIASIYFLCIVTLLTGCVSKVAIQHRIDHYRGKYNKASNDFDAANKEALVSNAVPKSITHGANVKLDDPEAKLAVLIIAQRGERTSVCTGVLIKKRVVLTAAHCVNNATPENVKVVFSVDGFETVAEKLTVHELYENSAANFADCALIKIPKDAPPGYPLTSFAKAKEKVVDDQVLLIGYGITSETSQDSMQLRRITKSFKTDIHIKDKIIGIDQKEESGGFCRGDSGGPLFVKTKQGQKLIGLNSFTIGVTEKQECHSASVAMYIPHFTKWIEKNLKTL